MYEWSTQIHHYDHNFCLPLSACLSCHKNYWLSAQRPSRRQQRQHRITLDHLLSKSVFLFCWGCEGCKPRMASLVVVYSQWKWWRLLTLISLNSWCAAFSISTKCRGNWLGRECTISCGGERWSITFVEKCDSNSQIPEAAMFGWHSRNQSKLSWFDVDATVVASALQCAWTLITVPNAFLDRCFFQGCRANENQRKGWMGGGGNCTCECIPKNSVLLF